MSISPATPDYPHGAPDLTPEQKSCQGLINDWLRAMASGQNVLVGELSYPAVPFSFLYGGKPSSELLPTWKKTHSTRPGTKPGTTDYITTWTDSHSGLECRFEVTEFANYPVLEWILYFRNTSQNPTEIISQVHALDVNWRIDSSTLTEALAAKVYRSRGSTAAATDFEYTLTQLPHKEAIDMEAGGGRSSNDWLPFFNVDLKHLGVITAIGWSGQWECRIDHQNLAEIHMTAGMQNAHLRLHPGEEIRTPRIMQLFWQRDLQAGHNLLRRFLLEHHTPHLDGKPIEGPFTIGHWGGMKTQGVLDRIAVYRRERLPMEYVWVDAGWYGLNSTYSPDEFLGDWQKHVGDWRANPRAHPDGLKPISRAARDAGMKFLLWIEPGRAIQGTKWPEEHPDWFLRHENAGDQLLLNLAKPEALEGAIELVSNLITEHEIQLFREDFNISPLQFWRKNDAPDRQGMTEIGCIVGLYKLWDALLDRHPGLIIDNCSSGGRRIDLETISRSVALWSSDYQCFPDCDVIGTQAQNLGLQYWLPLHGTGTWASKTYDGRMGTYRARSTFGPALQLSTFVRESQPILPNYPWDWFRKMCADYLRARPFFTGDFYLLTENNVSPATWSAYQMDRPDLGGGFVMAFRRQDAPQNSESFKLQRLDEKATYEVTNADTGKVNSVSGESLVKGLEIRLPESQSSALFFYHKITQFMS